MDLVMRGGLRPKELGVFMGPPGRGKSHALVHVARTALLLGYNVVHYTLEITWSSVMERVWSGIIDRPAQDLARWVPKMADYLAGQGENLGSLIVKAFPSHMATVPMLGSHLASLERNFAWKPHLVVVDYADILSAARHYDVRRDELATVYEDLRGLGQVNDLPIWTASQGNREAARRAASTGLPPSTGPPASPLPSLRPQGGAADAG